MSAVPSPLVVGLQALLSVLISLISSILQRYRRSWCWCSCFSVYSDFLFAQPLIIQQIIDKVIGQQNFNTLYFLCSFNRLQRDI